MADGSINYCFWNSRIEVDSHVDLCTIATIYIRKNSGVCTCSRICDTIPCVRQLGSADGYSMVGNIKSRCSHIECEISCLLITALVFNGESHGVGSSATCDRSSSPLYFHHVSSSLVVLCKVVSLDRISRSCHIRCSTRSQLRFCTRDSSKDAVCHRSRSCLRHNYKVVYRI